MRNEVEGLNPEPPSRPTDRDREHFSGPATQYRETPWSSQFNTEAYPSQGNSTSVDICNAPNGTSNLASSSASCKRNFANTGPDEEFSGTGRPAKHQRISKEQKDEQLVQTTTTWIKEELEKLSVQNFPPLVTPSHITLSQRKEDAQICADYLWRCADEVENASTAVVWSLRYTAACSLLVGTAFSSPSEPVGLEVRFWFCLRGRQIC